MRMLIAVVMTGLPPGRLWVYQHLEVGSSAVIVCRLTERWLLAPGEEHSTASMSAGWGAGLTNRLSAKRGSLSVLQRGRMRLQPSPDTSKIRRVATRRFLDTIPQSYL
jgi:hypothetical protein